MDWTAWKLGALLLCAATACGETNVDYGAGTCRERKEALGELIEANTACEVDEDCRIVGFVRSTCDCGPDSYDAVNAEVAEEAYERYQALSDCALTGCDNYTENVRAECVEGVCSTRGDSVNCLPKPEEPDAGAGDAGVDAGRDASP